jgi:hypothetical protein
MLFRELMQGLFGVLISSTLIQTIVISAAQGVRYVVVGIPG